MLKEVEWTPSIAARNASAHDEDAEADATLYLSQSKTSLEASNSTFQDQGLV